jgi:hypothetical protein
MRALLGLFALLLASRPAASGELLGVHFDDELTIDGKKLTLNGIGLRQKTIFNVNVYVAALYLEAPSPNASVILGSPGIKRVEVVFLRNATRDQVIDSWNEGFERNCKADCERLAVRLARLNSYMKDVRPYEHVLITSYPDRMEILFRGETRAIEGGDFARMVLATFIGPAPPSVALKDALLGAERALASERR